MHTITVVSLGPDSPELLTLGAQQALMQAPFVLLRTGQHGVAKHLQKAGIAFTTLDDCYQGSEDFDQFTTKAVEQVITSAHKEPLVYGVADPHQDETVMLLLQKVPDQIHILAGVPLSAPFISAANPMGPVLVAAAAGLVVHNAQQALCVVELNSRHLAGEVKLKLLPKYGEQAQVAFFPPSKLAAREPMMINLPEIDRQKNYDHTTGFVVFPQPLLQRTQFDAEDLLAIMRKLRAPGGCPWDQEQTHQSLIKHLVEEANEAASALLEEDWQAAADELGDVFLQLAFHAVVGEDYGTFTWEDMLVAICQKLIRRHPHIFGDMHLKTAADVLTNWEAIKQKERGDQQTSDAMVAVSKGLPSMMRAEKVQRIAAKVGFDWTEPKDALEKVIEEAGELMEAMGKPGEMLDEMGDLLFSCINTARLMGITADQALHLATEKFIKRFKWTENAAIADKKRLELLTINEIGVYWERSKLMP